MIFNKTLSNNNIVNDKNCSNNINITKIYEKGKYIEEYKNDKRERKGIMYYKSGNRYDGDWKNGKREGKGIFYFNNGDRYEGDFKNGNFEGKGIY